MFFCLLLLGVLAGSLLYQSARQSVVRYVDSELEAVARLKTDQAAHWLEEIEEGIEFDARRLHLAHEIQQWRAASISGVSSNQLDGVLARLCAVPAATDCVLHAPDDGRLLISYGPGSDSTLVRNQALRAKSFTEPQLEDFYEHHRSNPGGLEIGYFYAIRSESAPDDSVALLHMTFDPGGLFRVVTEGSLGTAQSLKIELLEPNGFSPEWQADTSSGSRAPRVPPEINLKSVHNDTALLTGLDALSVPVWARARAVPGTPWTILVKIDQADALHQVNTIALVSFAASGSLLFFTCFGWGAYRWRMKNFASDDLQKSMLTQRVDFLARYANDCIILADNSGNILEVNEAGASHYGYSASEMRGMPMMSLLPASARSDFAALLEKLHTHRSLIYQTEQCRKDGSTFPAEVSACLIEADGMQFSQSIIRDVSERQRLEIERATSAKRQEELSRRLLVVQELERRRISAELHDQAVASLAAIKLNLSTLDRVYSQSTGSAAAASIVAETRILLSETIEQIRDLCAELRPSVLDQMGLIPAIETCAQVFSRRSDIEILVRCEAFEGRFSSEVESMFFRILQEALRNCQKHAHAGHVEVHLLRVDEFVELSIADDGRGFDVERLGPYATGLGLSTMRERAEFAGAEFQLSSSQGQGTRVRVRLQSTKAWRSHSAIEAG